MDEIPKDIAEVIEYDITRMAAVAHNAYVAYRTLFMNSPAYLYPEWLSAPGPEREAARGLVRALILREALDNLPFTADPMKAMIFDAIVKALSA